MRVWEVSMDIKEIRVKKKELEDGILALLGAFQDVTGVRVDNLKVITFVHAGGQRDYGINIAVECI